MDAESELLTQVDSADKLLRSLVAYRALLESLRDAPTPEELATSDESLAHLDEGILNGLKRRYRNEPPPVESLIREIERARAHRGEQAVETLDSYETCYLRAACRVHFSLSWGAAMFGQYFTLVKEAGAQHFDDGDKWLDWLINSPRDSVQIVAFLQNLQSVATRCELAEWYEMLPELDRLIANCRLEIIRFTTQPPGNG